MRQGLTACDRCGLREVRHELEKKGVIIRFCDECYWGEMSENAAAQAPDAANASASSNREPK